MKAYFTMFILGIYDNLTSEHVSGQLKYDACMTEQVMVLKGPK